MGFCFFRYITACDVEIRAGFWLAMMVLMGFGFSLFLELWLGFGDLELWLVLDRWYVISSNSENSSVENGFPVQEPSAEVGESVVEEKYDAQPNDDPFPD